MDKQYIINRLMALPLEIATAEAEVINAQARVQVAKDSLATTEAELLISGKIDGKNAEQRAAQLRQETEAERAVVATTENDMAQLRAQLSRLQNEFRAMRSVARLLSSEEVA